MPPTARQARPSPPNVGGNPYVSELRPISGAATLKRIREPILATEFTVAKCSLGTSSLNCAFSWPETRTLKISKRSPNAIPMIITFELSAVPKKPTVGKNKSNHKLQLFEIESF
jgi:hypothetical protein